MVDDVAARAASLNADALNKGIGYARLDRVALDAAIRAQGSAFREAISVGHDHLFADVPLFIAPAQLQRMRDVIAAVERVVKLPGWMSSTSVQNECLGAFYGYDFHLNEQGAHLIEINTNAGGAFLNVVLIDSQRDADLPGKAVAVENLEQTFLAMFRNEWRLVRGDTPLKTIAIVDEQPEEQYLYPEFLLAKNLFDRAGIAAYVADPDELQAREDGLYFYDEKIDLVYNRLTDFSLQKYSVLHQAHLDGRVVLTPTPAHYVRYADKRNLARLSDADGLRSLAANEADVATLQAGIPHTFVVQSRHGGAQHAGAGGTASQLLPQSAGSASNVSQLQQNMEETLWQERKNLFFKPNSGYGSKGAYRGEKLTKRVFGEILQSDYVAQKLAPPSERAVCLADAEAVMLKYDVRCYVYDGQIQLVAARLYQGQTTNFRTPGGGFALVRVVE